MSAIEEKTETRIGADVLQDIANITGKPGLFRILKPGRAGVIIESLDAKREKSIASATAKVSVLKDVSVYVEDEEIESIPLSDIFLEIRAKHGETLAIDSKKASDKDLVEFLNGVLPNYDREKVYISDIRKIVSWYSILSANVPALFVQPAAEEAATEEEATKGKKKSK